VPGGHEGTSRGPSLHVPPGLSDLNVNEIGGRRAGKGRDEGVGHCPLEDLVGERSIACVGLDQQLVMNTGDNATPHTFSPQAGMDETDSAQHRISSYALYWEIAALRKAQLAAFLPGGLNDPAATNLDIAAILHLCQFCHRQSLNWL